LRQCFTVPLLPHGACVTPTGLGLFAATFPKRPGFAEAYRGLRRQDMCSVSVQLLEPRRLLAALASEVLLNDTFGGSSLNNANFYVPQFDPNGSTFLGDTQLQVSPTYSPSVSNGVLHLDLKTYNPTALTPGDSFFGSEVISQRQFTVGQGLIVDVRAQVPASNPAGIVSAPFLYTPPGVSGNHDEIDFELLTNNTDQVSTNVYADQPLGVGSPVSANLPDGDLADYHDYQITWLPNEVQWSVDGQVVRTETDAVPTGPMSLYLNTYVPSSDFAAAYNPALQPVAQAARNQIYDFNIDSVIVTQLIGPAKLAFAQQPASATTTSPLGPVKVDVEDTSSGTLLTSDNSDVTLAVASGPGAATLGGTTTVAAVNGVATFSNLSLSEPGTYTLTAGDGTLSSATSTPFNVTAGVVPTFGTVSLPLTVVAGSKFTARVPVIITNQGSAIRGGVTIKLYADAGASVDGNQVLITSLKKQVSLRTGQRQTSIFNIKSLPLTLTAGAYHLLAEVIDPFGATSVLATSQTVRVVAAFIEPAVSAGSVIPASIALGKSGSILITVANHGNETASGVDITLSPSTDGVTPVTGVMLGTVRNNTRIKPFQSKRFRLQFRVTDALMAGIYFPYLSVSLGGAPTTEVGTSGFTIG
jgi:hypothetical protein